MRYLYAITDQPTSPLPARPGLGSAPLIHLPHGDIAAVVSRVAKTQVGATEANVCQHEAVVEALMADRAVLPVRFGTLLPDETAAAAVLATHHADFVACLDRVRGHVEIGLRVLCEATMRHQTLDGAPWSSPPIESRQSMDGVPSGLPSADRSGRDYLLARVGEERQLGAWRQRAQGLAEELHRPLADLATDSTRRALVTPRMLLTAAYLVDRERVHAFRDTVGTLGTAHPTLQILCTGPWPPYSFVTGCVAASGEKEAHNGRAG